MYHTLTNHTHTLSHTIRQPREKGKMRFHKLQNVRNALEFLQKERKIKLVNIRPDEIVDGNPKLILGLTWTLILHFQVCVCVCVCVCVYAL